MVSRSVNTKPKAILDDPIISSFLKDLHDQFVIAQQKRLLTMSFLFARPSITVVY